MNNAHRIAALAILLLGSSACASDVDVEQQTTNVDEAPPVIEPGVEEQEASPSAYASRCDGQGALDIALSAAGMEAYEGLAVWMSAVEPTSIDSAAAVPEVVAFEQGEIVDGAFALACDDSLTENFAYPSFTVVIDADGSGDCSPGDQAGTFQGYGWMEDQIFDMTADQEGWTPVVWTTVTEDASVWGEDFCTYYFDDVRVGEG